MSCKRCFSLVKSFYIHLEFLPFIFQMYCHPWVFYDAKLNTAVVNNGFYGELSQVNLYSTRLNYKTDIVQLVSNPKVILKDVFVGWGNYHLSRGVRRIAPSTADGSLPTGKKKCILYFSVAKSNVSVVSAQVKIKCQGFKWLLHCGRRLLFVWASQTTRNRTSWLQGDDDIYNSW